MLAGIFLNCTVIASVWTSLQLRKKPCYFMIRVLSCFDLAVVTVTHPLIISAAVKLSHEDDIYYRVKRFIAVCLHGWSTLALFMMTVGRFLGLTYPFFHRTRVTNKRIFYLLGLLWCSVNILTVLSFRDQIISFNVLITVYIGAFIFGYLYFNAKMYIIAKTRRRNSTVPTGTARSSGENCIKRSIKRFKNISTCSLALFCFCISSFPAMFVAGLRSARKIPDNDKVHSLVSLWCISFVSMNSTFNCLIFFWKNPILRSKGIKILSRLLRSVNH